VGAVPDLVRGILRIKSEKEFHRSIIKGNIRRGSYERYDINFLISYYNGGMFINAGKD